MVFSNALCRLRRVAPPPSTGTPSSPPYVLRGSSLRTLGLLPAAPPLRAPSPRACALQWAQPELRVPYPSLSKTERLRFWWGVLLRLRRCARGSPARAAAPAALQRLLPPALSALSAACERQGERNSRKVVADLLPLVLASAPPGGGAAAARVGRRYLRLLACFGGAPAWEPRVGWGGPHERLDLARALLKAAPFTGGAEAVRLRASWLPRYLALCARLGAAGAGGAEVAAAAAAAGTAAAAGDEATALALAVAARKARRALLRVEVHPRTAAPFVVAPLDAGLEAALREVVARGGQKGDAGALLLLKRGADATAKPGAGGVLLDAELELALRDIAAAGLLSLAKQLLRRGAEVDAMGGDLGETPLMAAAQGGHKDVVELLLKRGADAAAKRRSDGATAAELAKDHPGVVKVLEKWLKRGSGIQRGETWAEQGVETKL